MRTFHRSIGAMAVAFAVTAFVGMPAASAAPKKLTYEQAWAKCKQELDAKGALGQMSSAVERSTMGGACMHKYGYRLKKSSM
jgi:hypothetical protein